MSKSNQKGITGRQKDYAQWYQDVVRSADLAEHSPVKGCMVIKPYGFSIWENMQKQLDAMIKETGHQNAYFPLFVPKSFLAKEAAHVEGFAKECAVVTHYRLKSDTQEGIVIDPEAKLEEELVIRPTSETIIYAMFSKWVESWRDLPLLINQWANIVRWEMRTRLFLRTTEFLWQEGHTAHATHKEAIEEALKMLNVYAEFAENYLAVPVIRGEKSALERFPGALNTYCIEALMQDGKSLQTGTSHDLGQNFAKAFDVQFSDKEGKKQYVWQTSWGVSTRLIGGVIMTHGDDAGLIVPPRIAPIHAVAVPVWKSDEEKKNVLHKTRLFLSQLIDIRIHLDERDFETPGAKFHHWEKKGVPLRIEIGPKDIEKNQIIIVRRDTQEKRSVPQKEAAKVLAHLLDDIQQNLFAQAQAFQKEHSYEVNSYEDFQKVLAETPGFIYAHWCGKNECEKAVVEETKASIRCIPFNQKEERGLCIKCGGTSQKRVVFAKAY